MLTPRSGLTDDDLAALADLERRVVAADGGRLKLEWATLRRRTGEQLLWHEDGQLQGFAGLYAFGPSAVEVAGAVAPQARRRGVGGALLDAALARCRERGAGQLLLVVPGGSAGGRALALSRGGRPDHSEHALVLESAPRRGPEDPRLLLRRALPGDAPAVGRLLEDAFGAPAGDLAERLADDTEQTLLAERDGEPVATLRLTREHGDDGPYGGVYGLAVDPARQGRGIGRDVLGRACRLLREQGAARVGLDVAVDNTRALGLYTSLGFTPGASEDYYAVRTADR